jgi:hypothetical protein
MFFKLSTAHSDNLPFGKKGVIVIKKEGDAAIYHQAALVESFNPAKESNKVLRP